jgi:succinate dehydrogenase/fumarate reductase flavoprotein subunit
MAKAAITTSESGKVRRVIVVGGGLAGLTTVIKLCEAGSPSTSSRSCRSSARTRCARRAASTRA